MSLRIDAAIVGAQRSGTTSLASALGQHPQVCLARGKETHLFDSLEVQREGLTEERLETFFSHRRPGQILLDATPSYLYLPGCLEALVRHSPGVRLIAVLRNPAERALSHHAHSLSRESEQRTAISALLLERYRLRREHEPLREMSGHRKWSYVDRGLYGHQLDNLFSLTDNAHVIIFEEMLADPRATLRSVHRFLGIHEQDDEVLGHFNNGHRPPQRMARLLARVLTRSATEATEHALGLERGSLPW